MGERGGRGPGDIGSGEQPSDAGGQPPDAAPDGDEDTRLLFVCTGNTCRSPMAEALAREAAARRGMSVTCRSAGTAAVAGGRASRGAVLAAREAGLDLSGHASSPLSRAIVRWADVVLCMSGTHVRAVQELAADDPAGGPGVALITEFLPEGDPERGEPVPDPVGGGLEVYRETLELLRESAEGLMEGISEP